MKTATYLINRMPPRVLDNKSLAELLLNSNEFVVSPKVFGCVCFVHDYRNDIRKLDPRAVKCVFVGYSSTKKGYCCWCPSEHRFFISMDVTFREYEPFMSQPMILELLFLHLKDNKRGRALFLFLLQLVPIGIIRFIVRGRKLITITRVGVIILAMEIYRVLCIFKT